MYQREEEEARNGAQDGVQDEIVGEYCDGEGMLSQSSDKSEDAEDIGKVQVPAEVLGEVIRIIWQVVAQE